MNQISALNNRYGVKWTKTNQTDQPCPKTQILNTFLVYKFNQPDRLSLLYMFAIIIL